MADELVLGAKLPPSEVYAMPARDLKRLFDKWVARQKATGGLNL